ncbi:MAG: hypothetical protein IE933_01270 [Sphingomonadales bacterium]|nr:hypothetical protein [Sphingomonadales bacterium]MBD3772012.1 hypothetical protein [Paracoccaceae bacterium]
MTSLTYRSSKPDSWTLPRAHRDASQRLAAYGPIQPLAKPSLLERIFGLR